MTQTPTAAAAAPLQTCPAPADIAAFYIREQWRHSLRITLYSLAVLTGNNARALELLHDDLRGEVADFMRRQS